MTGPRGPYKQLAPGVFEDKDGNMVFNLADMLQFMGVEDTPENRMEYGMGLRDLLAGQGQPVGAEHAPPVLWRPPRRSRLAGGAPVGRPKGAGEVCTEYSGGL